MGENMIAICLYICILLMAGTVLVLTIMYFVKPGSVKTSTPAECERATDTMPPKTEEGKANSDETYIPTMKTEEPKQKVEEVIPAIEPDKAENKGKDTIQAIENKEPENQEATPVKSVGEVRPAASGKNSTIVVAVKPEKDLNTNVPSQSVDSKKEKKDTPIPEEITTAKPIVLQSVKKPNPEVVKPTSENDTNTTAGKKESEQIVKAEAIKKEPESKMDNKNVKQPAVATMEKPKTTTEAAKPAVSPTNSVLGKKAQDQKTSLGDLSKMFSKEVVDDNEATKLAKDMKDVEIRGLIKDGQDIINLLKRNRS